MNMAPKLADKLLTAAFFFLLLNSLMAYADEMSSVAEQQSHEISSLVMSPFCPGRTLNDCPSSSASELRANITAMLSSGKSQEEVLEELYMRYGEQIRAMPKKEGIGLLAWILPGAFLFAGAAFLGVWLRRHRRAAVSVQQKPALDPEMTRRIEEEIGKN